MSSMRVTDKYYCGHDCGAWGSSCKGHDISLSFHGSSETYSLTLDDRHEVVLLSRPQMWALVNLAHQIAEEHADAGGPGEPCLCAKPDPMCMDCGGTGRTAR